MRWRIGIPVALLGLSLGAAPLFADELVEAAKKEKARREALAKKKGKATTSKKGAPPVLNNESLKKSGGRVSEATPNKSASASAPATGDDEQAKTEGIWRSRVEGAEQAVASARRHVEDLTHNLADLRRQAASVDDPNRRLQADQQARQTESEIPKAEQAVRDAEAAVDRIRDEARQAGIAPGALR